MWCVAMAIYPKCTCAKVDPWGSLTVDLFQEALFHTYDLPPPANLLKVCNNLASTVPERPGEAVQHDVDHCPDDNEQDIFAEVAAEIESGAAAREARSNRRAGAKGCGLPRRNAEVAGPSTGPSARSSSRRSSRIPQVLADTTTTSDTAEDSAADSLDEDEPKVSCSCNILVTQSVVLRYRLRQSHPGSCNHELIQCVHSEFVQVSGATSENDSDPPPSRPKGRRRMPAGTQQPSKRKARSSGKQPTLAKKEPRKTRQRPGNA